MQIIRLISILKHITFRKHPSKNSSNTLSSVKAIAFVLFFLSLGWPRRLNGLSSRIYTVAKRREGWRWVRKWREFDGAVIDTDYPTCTLNLSVSSVTAKHFYSSAIPIPTFRRPSTLNGRTMREGNFGFIPQLRIRIWFNPVSVGALFTPKFHAGCEI